MRKLKNMLALVKIICISWDILEIKKNSWFLYAYKCCYSNILFKELKRMFKIEARFLSLLKALLETSFSKTSYHTETSQSISNSNQSLFSDLRSIIDLQKIHYIDFKQNQASVLFSGLGTRLNCFFLTEKLIFLY